MPFKAIATPLAVAAGLALSTTAFAQTEIGTITVSDEDLPYVQQYCESLQAAYDDADPGTIPDHEPSVPAELATQEVQLSSLQLQDCEDAGLLNGEIDVEPLVE